MARNHQLALLVCALLSAAAMTSCTAHHQLQSPAQLKTLPVSRGFNHGSLIAPTPWQYLGSREGSHEFRYYFNNEGVLCNHRVSIPKSSTLLEFPEYPYKASQSWVTLAPGQKTFRFISGSKADTAL